MNNQVNIIVVKGEVNIGKTSYLKSWILDKKNVEGILTPKIDNARYFQNIKSNEYFKMESDGDNYDCLLIGKYKFSKRAFAKAEEIILDATKNEPNFLIIDEIGPLELNRSGFHNCLVNVLETITYKTKLILVIRNGLVDKVSAHFNLNNFSISYINYNDNKSLLP